MIAQVLIVNTAFYIYGNIRLKEICILNSCEQIKENIIAGSAFSAWLGSSAVAFIPDPWPLQFAWGISLFQNNEENVVFTKTKGPFSLNMKFTRWFCQCEQ